MLSKQKGVTFIGFLFMAIIAISLILAGVKIVPDYIEYSGVKKIINSIGSNPNFDSMTKNEIMESFDKNASTSYVTVVSGKDLIFSKDANGKNVVSVEYEVVKPLAFNLSALMEFKASTDK